MFLNPHNLLEISEQRAWVDKENERSFKLWMAQNPGKYVPGKILKELENKYGK